MINSTDEIIVIIRRNAKKAKDIITIAIVAVIVLSIAYFCFYGVLINEPSILDYTKSIVSPIADIFCPNTTGIIRYKNTAISLLCLVVPFIILYALVNFIEKFLLNTSSKIASTKIELKKKEAKKEYLRQFSDIKYYAIGISFDYKKNNSEIPLKASAQLNKILGDKIQSLLIPKATITYQGIITIVSNDFENYDNCLETVLKTLAKIKNELENKYKIQIIPTITTDASAQVLYHNSILNKHYAIKGCNLKNKVVTTNEFFKKYNYLGLTKYAGVSIGVYEELAQDSVSLDLNVVNKDLSKALDNIYEKQIK